MSSSNGKFRVLVADKIAMEALAPLQGDPRFHVEERQGLSGEELAKHRTVEHHGMSPAAAEDRPHDRRAGTRPCSDDGAHRLDRDERHVNERHDNGVGGCVADLVHRNPQRRQLTPSGFRIANDAR